MTDSGRPLTRQPALSASPTEPLRVSSLPGNDQAQLAVRPNWRDIPIVDLTDAEISQMTQAELRWSSDLLAERATPKAEARPPVKSEPEPAIAAIPPDDPRFDGPNIALMETGIRIWIYAGEHEVEGAFAGEKLPPLTAAEISSNSHVSVFWDRAQVVGFEPQPKDPTQ